jgi:hypothetical protein
VNHVTEILGLGGEAFLRVAYAKVLGREIDTEGMRVYSAKLRCGWSRSHVISELASSAEATEVKSTVRGLEEFVRNYKRGQRRTIFGWFHRAILGVESDLISARTARNPWLRS